MTAAALLPVVASVTLLVAIAQIFIVRSSRALRAQGRKPFGGSGPWVVPVVLSIIVVGWLVATSLLNR